MNRPDSDLLVRARSGDRAAFETLMRNHERMVFATAWRMLGGRDDAEDAAQEVFIRLFENLDRIDSHRALAPWISRVTVNVCLNVLRRRRVRKVLSLELFRNDDDLAMQSRELDPSTLAELRQEQSVAQKALAALPARERLAIILRDVQGLTTKETAEALGTSEATVRSQVCRARLKTRKFRERLLGRRRT